MPAAPEGNRPPSRVIVLDTNVLLADPNSILSFPRAEVVIPEAVLGELDKLKVARVDPDLRFRGREVSRMLFGLSEEGSLIDGVDLPDGGWLRVAPLDSDGGLPDGLSVRNADDRILATAYQETQAALQTVATAQQASAVSSAPATPAAPAATQAQGGRVELLTNDLNMLLKAQAFGLNVSRYGEESKGGFVRRFIVRPFQRYKVPLGILAIALGVFAAVIVIVNTVQKIPTGTDVMPPGFESLLSTEQQDALQALKTLEGDPGNANALLAMGNFYYDTVATAQQAGNQASVIQNSRQGVEYYERFLALRSDDGDARADMASLFFYSGQTDKAIQQVGTVLERDPAHINANFNLGIFYWQGRRDPEAARDQMNRVIDLTKDDPQHQATVERASHVLEQISGEISATGTSSEGGMSGH
ncbi:MAG: PIN domain-containing protein [Coriobacteriia bacterium]|nr:PIN domain-containing protein [Coriobacteriia bacterium]